MNKKENERKKEKEKEKNHNLKICRFKTFKKFSLLIQVL
jgi:hypothetical protein